MVESLNTKVELVTEATSFLGMPDYGKIMIGDKGFEFYNEKKPNSYIQIPWTEVDHLDVSVMFGGKWIPRYAVATRRNGTYTFASKDPKAVLRAVREHIPADKILKSLTFWQVFKSGGKNLFKKESWENLYLSLFHRTKK
ncbi:DUF956 family protein [Lacticaseibacillus daqingensis]|uniref:DUF956 family protein n=1 Tax=Lacticaseibacillus daqingensis TaxID=2486014 RepID=UPI000F7AD407|nr:DUF956 family protein [Lacticaseibacillus daqingensis]